MNSKIAIIIDNGLLYPTTIPFNPSIKYPEYLFENLNEETNKVYEGVRQLLFQLGFDFTNFGKKNWNDYVDE